MLRLVIALVLVGMLDAPTITYLKGDIAPFEVRFDSGALYGCTVYTSRVIERDGKKYAPEHCWILERDANGYLDDWAYIPETGKLWDVNANIHYETGVVSSTSIEVLH